jgi:hypothetical protein
MRVLFSMLAVLLSVGCSSQTEIQQQVIGQLTINGIPAKEIRVALVPNANASGCNQPLELSRLDQDGKFAFSRSAQIGRFAVLVQHDTLCIQEGGTWQVAWKGIYGPAPEKMVFACARAQSPAWQCTMNSLVSAP